MIGWMQNNNKYLVVTMWVATIAFIGAGAVGWGSASFGSQANSVAKVGDIEISKAKYGFSYNNAYQQKARELNGKFDKKKAKELGLGRAVLRELINEALLLNFAKDNGIIATEKEVGLEITSFDMFKGNDGQFDNNIYENFLKSRGLKKKDFESILKDEIVVRKATKLLNIQPVKLESDAISNSLNIADKIKYKVIKLKDINVTIDQSKLKDYWSKNSLNYMSKTKYKLNLLYTKADDLNISDSDIESYYKSNSFNYTDKSGKIKDLSSVKDLVVNDLKLSKIKKQAAIDRSRFKKGKLAPTETLVVEENDKKFTPEIWNIIKKSTVGTFIKPKKLKDMYVTINIKEIVKPKALTFEEAKPLVESDYKLKLQKEHLNTLVDNFVKEGKGFDLEPKDYISLSKFQVLPKLTPQDSMLVTRALFASDKKIGTINIQDGVVVYSVEDQKILDNNRTSESTKQDIRTIKSSELTSNLLNNLSKKYSTEIYIKDNR